MVLWCNDEDRKFSGMRTLKIFFDIVEVVMQQSPETVFIAGAPIRYVIRSATLPSTKNGAGRRLCV